MGLGQARTIEIDARIPKGHKPKMLTYEIYDNSAEYLTNKKIMVEKFECIAELAV